MPYMENSDDPRHDWYFTFGFGQTNEGCYYVVKNATEEEATKRMFAVFGNQWSMQYPSAEAAGVSQYNLREIK